MLRNRAAPQSQTSFSVIVDGAETQGEGLILFDSEEAKARLADAAVLLAWRMVAIAT